MKNFSLRIRPQYLQWVLREIYPPEKEALGVLAIHIAPAHGSPHTFPDR
jgi:hypothetical protein